VYAVELDGSLGSDVDHCGILTAIVQVEIHGAWMGLYGHMQEDPRLHRTTTDPWSIDKNTL